MLLFALLNMRLKTVVHIFLSLGLLFGTVLISIMIDQFYYPEKDVDKPTLTDELFQHEIEQVMKGESIEPAFPDIPVMVWWTPFSGDTGVQDCGRYKCFVTNDREYMNHPSLKNVFFYGTSTSEYDLPLPRGKDVEWSVLHEESPKNSQLFSHEDMMKLFNHTSTFRQNSDMSLSTQYLESTDNLTSIQYYKNTAAKNRYMSEEGYAPVVYVQSGCDAPSKRDLWVEEFMKHIPVDSFGSCLHNKELPLDMIGSEQMENTDFYQLLSRYKFVLSMENAVCQDYVTEKFWRTVSVGSVPIYLGAPNIEKFLPNNKSAILIKDFDSPAEVAELVHKLNKDDQAYEEHLSHKITGKLQNPWLQQQVDQRKWGVSREQQFELGNSVKHFQCLVCDRIARNMEYSKRGFNPAKFIADKSHYGCPVPKHPITHKVDHNDWYVQDWLRTRSVAKHLLKFLTSSVGPSDQTKSSQSDFKTDEFRQQVRDDWTAEFMKVVKGELSLEE
eukprot:TRINITY_DN8123_c0_g1_i1.p1 TRINITY_DN8123_c0_g1~~TRINITY_DN8123_c0_g1_i1.p1  ORF type:complete len:499 (-),score=69.42 TRINITY_DN8123_c0_g1_i1:318-1814(-)